MTPRQMRSYPLFGVSVVKSVIIVHVVVLTCTISPLCGGAHSADSIGSMGLAFSFLMVAIIMLSPWFLHNYKLTHLARMILGRQVWVVLGI